MEDSKTNPHKQKELIIKSAKIDEGIYDFVKWLNCFKSIETQFSCEGHSEEEIKIYKESEKYKELDFNFGIGSISDDNFHTEVIFFCDDFDHLKIILDCIQTFKQCTSCGTGLIKTVVSYCKKFNRLSYNIVFENKEHPASIVKYYYNNYKPLFIERKLKFIP